MSPRYQKNILGHSRGECSDHEEEVVEEQGKVEEPDKKKARVERRLKNKIAARNHRRKLLEQRAKVDHQLGFLDEAVGTLRKELEETKKELTLLKNTSTKEITTLKQEIATLRGFSECDSTSECSSSTDDGVNTALFCTEILSFFDNKFFGETSSETV
jgi:chromosome segregation ATPase